MKTKKKPESHMCLDEKQLKKVAFLLYENYRVSEKELEECKRIIENFQESEKSFLE